MKEYKTILNEANDSFIEKKSRFIGHIKPVTTQDESLEFIRKIKASNSDATHNVTAYSILNGNILRYNDDGEPQGTAGVPVLDVLQKEQVTNAVIVVTRYFGGILLGAGGLVRAYSHAAKIAVDAGQIITMAQCDSCSMEISYSFYDRFLIILNDNEAVVVGTAFSSKVMVNFYVNEQNLHAIQKAIDDASNGLYKIKITGKIFARL